PICCSGGVRSARNVGGLPWTAVGCVRSSHCVAVSPSLPSCSSPSAIVQTRAHEAGEERVWIPRPPAEFRGGLAGHEERVIVDLDDLDELLLGPEARHPQPVLLQRLEVVVVDLVAMPMALTDDGLAPVEPRCGGTLGHQDRVQAQPHRAALVGETALL